MDICLLFRTTALVLLHFFHQFLIQNNLLIADYYLNSILSAFLIIAWDSLASFQESIQKDGNFALASYGAAVANARLQNEAKVIENLTNAVRKDPSLKDMALNDLEFRNFNISSALN